MSQQLSLDRLRAVRMIAHLLAPSAALPHPAAGSAGGSTAGVAGGSAVSVAKHMLASQAQNRAAALQALDLRSGHTRHPDHRGQAGHPGQAGQAADALGRCRIIRSWSQRGTHQLLAAEDVRWMTLLCSPRILAASAKRRESIGLDDAAVNRARGILQDAASTPVPRREAYRLFATVDVDPGEGRGQHLLRHFGGEGTLVQGPPQGAEDTFVLLDSVCALSISLVGDAALEEMTVRYFRARGAAQARDLQWWSGLTVAEVKRGIGLAVTSGEIHPVEGPGGEAMWMPSYAADITAAEVEGALESKLELPAFDEYLLSYTDRSHVMDPAHSMTIGPGKNGIFRAFRVRAGEALPL